jgi:hypothetical protein
MNINLHIEQLVLDGLPFSSGQGRAIAAAMEAELTRRLTIEGLPMSASRAEPQLPAGHFHIIPDRSPRTVGQQIGRTVHHLLNQSKQTTTNKTNTLGAHLIVSL